MTGVVPEDDEKRAEDIRSLLANDLLRQGVPGLVVDQNEEMNIPGIGKVNVPIRLSLNGGQSKIVDLSGAITPFRPSKPELRQFGTPPAVPIRLINELEVQRNLPSATASVLSFIGLDV
jgi:hypothetical protein